MHDIRSCLYARLLKKQNCEFTINDLSNDDLAIDDLAIGCLGVHAIEGVDVRVATNFVKIMRRKKIARNTSSNFDFGIRSSLFFCRRLATTFMVGLKTSLAFKCPA